jgi:hypothetical protein
MAREFPESAQAEGPLCAINREWMSVDLVEALGQLN